jgi:hypothetical protein
MGLNKGDKVTHLEYGQGIVKQILGDTVVVNFYGDDLDVDVLTLTPIVEIAPPVTDRTKEDRSQDKTSFRAAFEAINLGVAPPDSGQLIDLTIRSDELKKQVSGWLTHAPQKGLCKVVFGYYGSGKSHMLKFVRSMALKAGWAVAYLEFDPKAADPAKPHLVYQNLMAALEFPKREDGRQSEGFIGFVKEVRDHWAQKNIRNNAVFKSNPWFSRTFEILMKYPHMPDVMEEYLDACLWLAGNHNSFQTVNALAREKGLKIKVPRMPVTKETADIYVHHLVVVNTLCKLLGYKGLTIILDEAEHVRGFNVRRRERANNLFELLARSAHLPNPDDDDPAMNDHGMPVPSYWNHGPHFALFVGLTEADTFLDQSLSLREACLFLRTDEDRIMLANPSRADYAQWCDLFLKKFCSFYPLETKLIGTDRLRARVVDCLAENYAASQEGVALRNMIKLASLVPCMLLSRPEITFEELISHLKSIMGDYLGNALPWE